MRNRPESRALAPRVLIQTVLCALGVWLALGVSAAAAATWWGDPSLSITSLSSSDPFGGSSIERNSGDNKFSFTIKDTKAVSQGETLICAATESGAEPAFVYRWLRNGVPIAGATGATYTLAPSDSGTSVQCQQTVTNASGDSVVLTLLPVVIAPAPASAAPVSSLTPFLSGGWGDLKETGEELFCQAGQEGNWSGEPTFGFQWLRNGAVIAGATNEAYTLVAADKGASIQCRVTGSNAGGTTVADSSNVVVAPAPAIAPAGGGYYGVPSIVGVAAKAGERLFCDEGSWSESPTGYSYQWLRDGTALEGATAREYVLQAADEGQAIQCRVTAENDSLDNVVAVSDSLFVAPVSGTPPPALASAPTLSGTPVAEGTELTCSTGGWAGSPTFTRQWLRDGVEIPGETGEKYKLGGTGGNSGEDVGKAIQCQVTAVNSGGAAVAVTGENIATPEPANPGVPSPNAQPQVGIPPVTVADVLPTGMILGHPGGGPFATPENWTCIVATVRCKSTSTPILPGESASFVLAVRASAAAQPTVSNEVLVSGGGSPSTSRQASTVITPAVGFGIESDSAWITDELGNPFSQSTGHPFEATTQFAFNTTTDEGGGLVTAGGDAKNIEVQLPPGFVGSPQLAPRCAAAGFEEARCPEDTAVGIVRIPISGLGGATIENGHRVINFAGSKGGIVYNLKPPPGSPAAFGFHILSQAFYLSASVRSDSDYGITVTSTNTPPGPELIGSEFSFCGNGVSFSFGFILTEASCRAATPGSNSFVQNPAKCTGAAPQTTLRVNTWEHPEQTFSRTVYTGNALIQGAPSASESFVKECDHLKFDPTIEAVPLSTQADSATGVSVQLKVPQHNKIEVGPGDKLTCMPGPWGNSPTGFSYQWLSNGSEVAGGNGRAYTIAAGDQGKSIQCLIKASNATNASATLASLSTREENTLTATTVPPVPATALPVPPGEGIGISGTPSEGETLTCAPDAWVGAQTFAYQWLRNGSPIAGATSATYQVESADVSPEGSVLQCEVIAANAAGSLASVSGNYGTSPEPSPAPPTAPGGKVRPEVSVASIPNTPEVKDVVVTFPAGLSLSPSAAEGLEGCTDAQFAAHSLGGASCPDASQIGTVKITTPLLSKPLEGQLYLGQPLCGDPSPCTDEDAASGRMFRLFIQAIDPSDGVVVKVTGNTSLDPSTGQVTASFKENPQLPFEVLELKLKNGPRAPLATPQSCGTGDTHSEFVPWSTGGLGGVSGSEEITGTPNATADEPFTVDWDGHGGACPATLPFGPGFDAGTSSTAPGIAQGSGLSVTLSRADREQNLGGISLSLPEGLLGMVSKVDVCGEPQAREGTCDAGSKIGTVTAGAGPGSHPFYVTGSVYLTTSYKGAPYGLSIVVPTRAGPFNLGNVVVRATVNVDPHDAHLTIVSDPLPQILDGIPLRLRSVNVNVDKPGFIVNPSSCNPKQITATIVGAPPRENQSEPVKTSPVSSPYEVGGCTATRFNPTFTASTDAKASSRARGASLVAKVTQASGEADIRSVRVELPKALPARLTTLQKACSEAQFAANPAGCPAESVVGTAVAQTPVLPVALVGPAYFVSHGGAKFPELVVVLQAQGVTIVLNGETFIDAKTDVTSSTFNTVPDAPISSFELTLPVGPHSALAANGSLCLQTLVMPTTLTGQNGAVVKHATPIEAAGCPNSVSISAHKVTGRTLKLSVYLPAAGKLKVSGRGLNTVSKSVKGRETSKLTLHATKSGKFSTKVTVSFAPTVRTGQVKSRPVAKLLKVTFQAPKGKAKS